MSYYLIYKGARLTSRRIRSARLITLPIKGATYPRRLFTGGSFIKALYVYLLSL